MERKRFLAKAIASLKNYARRSAKGAKVQIRKRSGQIRFDRTTCLMEEDEEEF
jgi:hypothetical protein